MRALNGRGQSYDGAPGAVLCLCFGRFVSPVRLNAEKGEADKSTSVGGESAIDSLLGVSPVSMKKEREGFDGEGWKRTERSSGRPWR